MTYNWQHKNWPEFQYNLAAMEGKLLVYADQVGHVRGVVEGISQDEQMDIVVSTMVAEAIKTSEIEGEYLSRHAVMSSIRNDLGLSATPEIVKDKRAAGVAEMLLQVRKDYLKPLTEQTLFAWHTSLLKGNKQVTAGKWRTSAQPMQVVSGSAGKEVIHFEAPPSDRVPEEMKAFIQWFNQTAPGASMAILHAPVRAALAHLYFESIHPFEDGNGRVGRAISEKVLSQHAERPILLSLSQEIESNRKQYYAALKSSQQTLDTTEWIAYFTDVILRAQETTLARIGFVLKKARFLDRYRAVINDRQLKVLLKMLEQPEGFEGGMSAKKYVSITGASKPTATRDLQQLVDLGAIKSVGAGRSTRYEVVLL